MGFTSILGLFLYIKHLVVKNYYMEMIDECDLDYESYGFKSQHLEKGILLSTLKVDSKKQEKESGFRIGDYKILSCHNLYIMPESFFSDVEKNLVEILNGFIKEVSKNDKILVVGIGNDDVISDSFGVAVVEKIFASNNFKNLKNSNKICKLTPNVKAKTGIETYDVVVGVAKIIDAKLIVLVDSYLTNNLKRIGHSFQLSSVGMIPGGGVGNDMEISKKTTGIDCISIGVPFMLNLKKSMNLCKDIIFSPRDIQKQIDLSSQIVANSLNQIFVKDLSLEEIKELMH